MFWDSCFGSYGSSTGKPQGADLPKPMKARWSRSTIRPHWLSQALTSLLPGNLQQQQLPADVLSLRVLPVLLLCVRFWVTLGSDCRLCTASTFFPMSGSKGDLVWSFNSVVIATKVMDICPLSGERRERIVCLSLYALTSIKKIFCTHLKAKQLSEVETGELCFSFHFDPWLR